jgi:predicted RNase H-like nuclease (RuvC/YqgF family)
MKVEDVVEIKAKIEKLKAQKNKAEGAIENIRKRWKIEYGCNSEEEVKAKIKELDESIKENEKRVTFLLEKVEKAYDWDEV